MSVKSIIVFLQRIQFCALECALLAFTDRTTLKFAKPSKILLIERLCLRDHGWKSVNATCEQSFTASSW